ncbi:hypothetical protein [Pseudodesulfovibrio sediminis]|uniref:Uncharacterized protein n=1 Tax=Pseudodesulfovibrio sediminis TaxID=2810563 RepID=A0ABN6ESZ0_9BACT|nr:hypothetical protein [Pseudodesulfovibrio sediminis]BCS88533.1 hypothetical protein PSDVSF_17750 [Pseudodesulfovibrio sediminis]
MKERRRKIMLISRQLLLCSGGALAGTALLFLGGMLFNKGILITAVVFGCGILGGFVSIQQRLTSIDDDELDLLSKSWASVLIIPLFGGIFALVLYVLFLTEIMDLDIFPKFYIPEFIHDRAIDIPNFLQKTSPASGQDMAKMMFWSFLAGFSERLVPQVIQSVASQAGSVSRVGGTGAGERPTWRQTTRAGLVKVKTRVQRMTQRGPKTTV